jgi:hypothetical protein
MSQTAILAALSSMKKQLAVLETLVTSSPKNLTALPLLPLSEAEDEAPATIKAKAKVKKQLSPERLAYLKSDEHKAKLQAGLAAYRAKKAAEKAADGASAPSDAEPEKHISSGSSDSGDSTSRRRGPKKLTEMTPEELEAHKAKITARKAKKAATE